MRLPRRSDCDVTFEIDEGHSSPLGAADGDRGGGVSAARRIVNFATFAPCRSETFSRVRQPCGIIVIKVRTPILSADPA
jgi:hypothetical protein